MSDWSDLGLPLPDMPGYGYTIDAGLLRVGDLELPRQKRLYASTPRLFNLRFILTRQELEIAEAFIQDRGYAWFTMDLISGGGPSPLSVSYVRFMEAPHVSSLGDDTYALAGPAEQMQLSWRSTIVTTMMYPIVAEEMSGAFAPQEFIGDSYGGLFLEPHGVTPPATILGTYTRTAFWHYVGPQGDARVPGPEGADPEDLEPFTCPDPPAECGVLYSHWNRVAPPPVILGTYEQTVFWNEVEVEPEEQAVIPETAFVGTYAQTLFHVYVDADGDVAAERASATPPATITGTYEHV
jgi:hypothetical protein